MITTIACCTALLLSSSGGFAAENKADSKHPSGKLVKGSEVTDAKLFDQQGKHIGEIKDVLFDENTGGLTHAIVSVGGWAGIGEKESEVPWKFVKPSKDKANEFVLTVDQSKLKDAENYDRNSWPDFTESWFDKNYKHYGLTAKNGAKLVRASKVIGADVYDQKGDKMGQINNVLMHPNTGKVAFATLDIGNWVGQGDKLTNVPWPLVRQSEKETAGFVVNADKAKLHGATYFERNSWPDYDNNWGLQTNTYGYYGYEPYWTDPHL